MSQAMASIPYSGAAVYNKGTVRLLSGAIFTGNFVYADTSDSNDNGIAAASTGVAGDGGAVWNGSTGRMVFGSNVELESNGVGDGGRGGALWNEGFIELRETAVFSNNEVCFCLVDGFITMIPAWIGLGWVGLGYFVLAQGDGKINPSEKVWRGLTLSK